jgi:hypothetical protein
MNSVHLIGRLATDLEVKEVNGGSKVSSFILTVDRTAEEADFALLRIESRRTTASAAETEQAHASLPADATQPTCIARAPGKHLQGVRIQAVSYWSQ